MINFRNPFKYRNGLWGFLFTFVFIFLSLIDDIIGLITLTVVHTSFAFKLACWETIQEMDKKINERDGR